MIRPLCNRAELLEEIADSDARWTKLCLARPVSWRAAFRRQDGLAAERARKAALVAELAALRTDAA